MKSTFRLPLSRLSPSGRASPPLTVNLLVTDRCNQSCVICQAGPRQGPEKPDQKEKELSRTDLMNLFDQVRSFRPSLFLGGGEPFVREDILKIVKDIKDRGRPAGLVTNGLEMTPGRSRSLASLGVETVIVSIHGLDSVHDRTTRVQGSFEQSTENIIAFCRMSWRPRIIINVAITPDNIEEMPSLALLGRRLGVDHVRFEHLLFIKEGETKEHMDVCMRRAEPSLAHDLAVGPLAADIAFPLDFDKTVAVSLQKTSQHFGRFVSFKPILNQGELGTWYRHDEPLNRRCLFIWHSLFIDSQGNVIPCERYRGLKLGNIRQEPLLTIWNGPRYLAFRRLIRDGLLPACSRCDKL